MFTSPAIRYLRKRTTAIPPLWQRLPRPVSKKPSGAKMSNCSRDRLDALAAGDQDRSQNADAASILHYLQPLAQVKCR